MPKCNLEGQKFNRLTAIKDVGRTKHMAVLWECLCECGGTKIAVSAELKNGHVKSCGCLKGGAQLGNKNGLGTKRTAESKAKISKALKGRTLTAEHCENIKKSKTKEFRRKLSRRMSGKNNPMYGKATPDSVKAKISEAMKGNQYRVGHKHSLEARQKMSIAQKGKRIGEDNPRWKGGKRPQDPYCAIFRDEEFRSMIFGRDNHQCQNPDCWGNCKEVCGHHINYNKQDCIPANVITLCRSCNTRANAERVWHKAFYRAVMYRRYGIDYNSRRI